MSTDTVAVRVNRVSKIYHLWNSPKDRLIDPLKRALSLLLPPGLRLSESHVPGYREFHALEDVSFEIRKGESWGFIGVNGSGKSTLLKIISGNLRPSAGTVEVDGKVAILDYGSGFNGDFTGRENVFLKGSLLGLSKRQLDERFNEIEAFADIGEFIDQPVKTYSSGMTARLGFAIMAHVNADILITDEALAVGDAFFVQKCMRHIRSFLKHGTFLFVSHSVNDVMSLCTHAVWLEHGSVVRTGKASEVCLAYINSIDRRKSGEFLDETNDEDNDVDQARGKYPEQQKKRAGPVVEQLVQRPFQQINVSAVELAALKNYYAPSIVAEKQEFFRTALVEIREPAVNLEDVLDGDGAVGGGKIFSVTITDDQGKHVPSVLGGEVICLTVRAVAEKIVQRPILGFQLKNHLGLTLVAENTFLATREQDIGMVPGEVIAARFRFMMPLVSVGEYVIRAGLADGVEDNNALIDVKHEALLLRCNTSGVRHGLVGIPMLAIDVTREEIPQLNGIHS